MLIQFTNFAATTLAGGITNVATSANLSAGTGALFPALTGSNYFYAVLTDAATGTVREIVKVTARTTDAITIARAQEGTTGVAWLNGDRFEIHLTAASLVAITGPEAINAGATKATPVDGDYLPLYDSAATTTQSKLSWANLKATLIATAMTWTGIQTITNSCLKLLGSSTGATTFTSANAGASNYTHTFPARSMTISGLDAETWTGTKTQTEGTSLQVPAVGITDQTWGGITEAGTLGATVALGELCYFDTATSKWKLASGAAAGVGAVISTGKLGICLVAGNDAGATTMLLYGKVRANSLFDTFTIGAPVYMSAATAGKIVSAAPTGTTDFTVRKVGYANSGDEIMFDPSPDFATLA